MMNKPECKGIVRSVLPAVRASVASTMHSKYGYSQEEIAEKLGVVQVAVSKYLRSRYSVEIAQMKKYIVQHGLSDSIVSKIVEGESRQQIDRAIDELCDSLATVKVT